MNKLLQDYQEILDPLLEDMVSAEDEVDPEELSSFLKIMMNKMDMDYYLTAYINKKTLISDFVDFDAHINDLPAFFRHAASPAHHPDRGAKSPGGVSPPGLFEAKRKQARAPGQFLQWRASVGASMQRSFNQPSGELGIINAHRQPLTINSFYPRFTEYAPVNVGAQHALDRPGHRLPLSVLLPHSLLDVRRSRGSLEI